MSESSYPHRTTATPTEFSPPGTSTSGGHADDSSSGGARERASETASHAADAGRDVAHEARERAGDVAHEAADRAKDLWGEAQSQASSQVSHQQGRLAEQLRGVGSELGQMSRASDEPGYASQAAERGAQAADRLADWFEHREPSDVLHEVEDFARRRPGAFIAIAAGAGLVVGRLLRGAKEAKDSGSPRSSTGSATSSPVGSSIGSTTGSVAGGDEGTPGTVPATTGGVSDADRP